MPLRNKDHSARRKPVNVSLPTDLVAEARKLKINTSRAAETGIADAVRKAREEAWKKENRQAIEEHNARIAKHGTYIRPRWLAED